MKMEISDTGTATYCPEDNKLRLYVGRVPRPEYDALRAEGWTATPKQGCNFVATWTPEREDTALLYGEGIIDDEDQDPGERAAERAERFGGYLEKRTEEATAQADRYEDGQRVHGYQNAARAERAARRHDSIADKAVNLWGKAEYWTRRTAGVIEHAIYKDAPGVRMGRIKMLEAEKRKSDKASEEYARKVECWRIIEGMEDTAKAHLMACSMNSNAYDYHHPRPESETNYQREHGTCLYSLLTHEKDPITAKEAARMWLDRNAGLAAVSCRVDRWRDHYALRLAYENQMLAAQGGMLEQVADIEPGGWIGKHQIQKVTTSPATGRVVSVYVHGTHYGYTKASGYTKQEEMPCMKRIETERLPPGSYRAPTDEERKAFQDARKQAKEARGVVSIINPTPEDAARLQAQMNAQAAITDKGKNYPRKAGEIETRTQAQYSASCSENKAMMEIGGCKVRIMRHGWHWQYVEGVVVLTDKPQKRLPAAVWQAAEPVRETLELEAMQA